MSPLVKGCSITGGIDFSTYRMSQGIAVFEDACPNCLQSRRDSFACPCEYVKSNKDLEPIIIMIN
jgi:hypothetical protein